MEGYITTTEAAERLGISSARVRQLVVSGDLPVTKFGPVNMVKEDDLELIRERRGVGRPPKSSPVTEKRATGKKRATNGTSAGKKKGGQR
ncbi:MAG: helix-turn-helix domain-containing protein [Acidobacteria bacterium]|nr:helix-turn-helix domain-containing protein [Acidobacteriota bacterium]